MLMRVCAFVLVLMLPLSAAAFEIKLDETWLPKLAQLCDAARYGARMTSEPICNELGAIVQKLQVEDAKAKQEKKDGEPPK